MLKTFNDRYSAPAAMKAYNNWAVWGLGGNITDKTPYNPKTGNLASSIDPNTWVSYDRARSYAERYSFAGVGFMLSPEDPFCIIDLDYPDGNPEIVSAQEAIFKNFYSYAEISPSGKGLHIIVKGYVPRGRKRNKIEVYSQKRFMTVTGNAYRNVDIYSCQEELIKLYASLGGSEEQVKILDQIAEEVNTDEEIYEIASRASNGEKFINLWEGNWHHYYPNDVNPFDSEKGASVADMALIDILAYYTDSKRQIVRMFQKSALGKRKKAKREDYLNYMLDKCFDNKLPLVDLTHFQNEIAHTVAEVNLETENPKITTKKEKSILKEEAPNPYSFPPGLVGEVAQFLLDQAPRPVPEIALAGALGFISGIVGKAYNVSGTGLNQYYLLLAETGRGKEAMAKGIEVLMSYVSKINPAANDFVGPGQIESPQALIRHMDSGYKSFVCILGEFGVLLKQMSLPNAPSNILGLRRLLLDLYNKSGSGQQIRPSIYADKTKNTKGIVAPAFSILAESAPEIFYEVLDESMISGGWLPRWLCIEYKGPRVPKNFHHDLITPSDDLVNKVVNLCSNSLTLNSQNVVVNIKFTKEANILQAKYDKFCDDQINNTSKKVRAELWNRAHLKVLKLASIVAVGINPIDPIVCENCINWAIGVVNKDCINIIQRFDTGEVGATVCESTQILKILEVLTTFVGTDFNKLDPTTVRNYKMSLYHSEKIVPYSYIHRRLSASKYFKGDKIGSTNAIKRGLKTLMETDDIELLSMSETKRKFGTTSPGYIIKNVAIIQDAKRKGII